MVDRVMTVDEMEDIGIYGAKPDEKYILNKLDNGRVVVSLLRTDLYNLYEAAFQIKENTCGMHELLGDSSGVCIRVVEDQPWYRR